MHHWCLARTDIDIDDDLVRLVMRRFEVEIKREAVDLALRRLVGTPLTRQSLLALEGTGWDRDLDAMRADPAALNRVEQLTEGLPSLPVEPVLDFRAAAALHRLARSRGEARPQHRRLPDRRRRPAA